MNNKETAATLDRYRMTVDEYRKWLCMHPNIARVLDNLKAAAEGEALNGGTPHGGENCTIQGPRTQVERMEARPIVAAPDQQPVFWQFRYVFHGQSDRRGAWSSPLTMPRTMKTGLRASADTTYEVRELFAGPAL